MTSIEFQWETEREQKGISAVILKTHCVSAIIIIKKNIFCKSNGENTFDLEGEWKIEMEIRI